MGLRGALSTWTPPPGAEGLGDGVDTGHSGAFVCGDRPPERPALWRVPRCRPGVCSSAKRSGEGDRARPGLCRASLPRLSGGLNRAGATRDGDTSPNCPRSHLPFRGLGHCGGRAVVRAELEPFASPKRPFVQKPGQGRRGVGAGLWLGAWLAVCDRPSLVF